MPFQVKTLQGGVDHSLMTLLVFCNFVANTHLPPSVSTLILYYLTLCLKMCWTLPWVSPHQSVLGYGTVNAMDVAAKLNNASYGRTELGKCRFWPHVPFGWITFWEIKRRRKSKTNLGPLGHRLFLNLGLILTSIFNTQKKTTFGKRIEQCLLFTWTKLLFS